VRKSKFSEAQIVAALKEIDAGTPATTLARRFGVHVNTLRTWKDKYGGLETSDLVRLKQLEAENAQMKRIIARKVILRLRVGLVGMGLGPEWVRYTYSTQMV